LFKRGTISSRARCIETLCARLLAGPRRSARRAGAMAYESWRFSRTELRDLLNRYEKAVEEDASAMLRPTEAERKALPAELLSARLAHIRKARDANRRFVEAVVEDLPDLCAGPSLELPARPVLQFRELPEGMPVLPSSSYGSMASVFLHLLRDWSAECKHVEDSTYAPVIAELRKLLPSGGEVLVPGAGLTRLAVAVAAQGYKVEANEGSRLFLTFADYMLNRAPPAGATISPLAHVFSENWGYAQQYLEVATPSPAASDVAMAAGGSSTLPVVMVPGEFVNIYKKGGPAYRKFNAIMSCFFLDTVTDIVELMDVMDGLLDEGGVWINVGPLNWRKETRLKLNWEEMTMLWKHRGYEFVMESSTEADYHLQRGQKMYTESYKCALTAAIKRRPPQS